MTESEAASTAGDLGVVAECAALSIVLFLGYILDAFGRKWPLVIGLYLSGISMACSPLPNKIGGLYVFRSLANIGSLPTMSSPL